MRDSEDIPFCIAVSGGDAELDALCLAMEDLHPRSDPLPMIAWKRGNERGHRVIALAPIIVRNAVYVSPGATFVSMADALPDMTGFGSILITHSNSAEAVREYESWSSYSP